LTRKGKERQPSVWSIQSAGQINLSNERKEDLLNSIILPDLPIVQRFGLERSKLGQTESSVSHLTGRLAGRK